MEHRFDAAIGGATIVNTSAAELAAAGHAPADIAAATSAATGRAVEAEMRRRIDAVWAGKRASAQSYWTAIMAAPAATADEKTDAVTLASGDAWESAMLDAAKALAAKGDLDAARTDAAWPPAPAALLALIAEPFAL